LQAQPEDITRIKNRDIKYIDERWRVVKSDINGFRLKRRGEAIAEI